jgi:hypothetical protein
LVRPKSVGAENAKCRENENTPDDLSPQLAKSGTTDLFGKVSRGALLASGPFSNRISSEVVFVQLVKPTQANARLTVKVFATF